MAFERRAHGPALPGSAQSGGGKGGPIPDCGLPGAGENRRALAGPSSHCLDHAPRTEPGGSARDLFPLVYRELHLLAERWMRREPRGHTLQATAVVHEAYLRLAAWDGHCHDTTHFHAVAVRAIRQVLVNHAQSRRAMRRGGELRRVPLRDDLSLLDGPDVDLLALDEALTSLEGLHERQVRVIELRFFGGLSVDEVAEVLGCSPRTVDGDWAVARAWLRERLSRGLA